MAGGTAVELLEDRWTRNETRLCVGLDLVYERILEVTDWPAGDVEAVFFRFACNMIDVTHQHVCAFKPNSAFYEAHGEAGIRVLRRIVEYIHMQYPDIPVLYDAKRGDIGSTNNGYAESIFDYLGMDGLTVHNYLGREAMTPFLDRESKLIIVLSRTSNPGGGELQDLFTTTNDPRGRPDEMSAEEWLEVLCRQTMPLYERVAHRVVQDWNRYGNCGIVAGATYPGELARIRQISGDDVPLLIPGIGTQGGDVRAAVEAGKNSRGGGMIINSSSGMTYPTRGDSESYLDATERVARELREEINLYC